jgi:hypothetical protein
VTTSIETWPVATEEERKRRRDRRALRRFVALKLTGTRSGVTAALARLGSRNTVTTAPIGT